MIVFVGNPDQMPVRTELLVPLRSTTEDFEQVVESKLSTKGFDLVTFSINGDPSESLKKYLHNCASRITNFRVVIQPEDIGLYGNFRALIQLSLGEFVCISSYDDYLIGDVISPAIKKFEENPWASLIILPHVWQECFSKPLRWEGLQSGARVPNFENRGSSFHEALFAEPSWIFGVWRSSYLKTWFPKKDFDWLDVTLLQEVILSRKTISLVGEQRLVIGTWNHSLKKAHSVSGRKLNPLRWLLRSIVQFAKYGFLLNPIFVYRFLREQISRTQLAKKLNRQK